MDRQTDRNETVRQTGRLNRHTDTQTTKTDRQTDTKAGSQTD
jgi:hypothetical protein